MALLSFNSDKPLFPRDMRFQRIQAMRFFAAAIVVVTHVCIFYDRKYSGILAPSLLRAVGWTSGWAVAAFFAISGFVITHASVDQTPIAFLKIRFLRIYPAFWLAAAITISVKIALWGQFNWSREGITFKSLSLLPFGAEPYPLGVEWSLIYEVFFYLVTALSLLLRRRSTALSMTLWLMLIIGATSIGLGYSDELPSGAWILISQRNLPFIAGAFAYLVAGNEAFRSYRPFLPLWALAAALFIQVVTGSAWILGAQAISGFLVVVWAAQSDLAKPMEKNGTLVHFGDASYGLYLMHIPIITIILAVWKTSGDTTFVAPSLLVFAVAGGLGFGLIERSIYKRLRKVFVRERRPNRALSATEANSSPPTSDN